MDCTFSLGHERCSEISEKGLIKREPIPFFGRAPDLNYPLTFMSTVSLHSFLPQVHMIIKNISQSNPSIQRRPASQDSQSSSPPQPHRKSSPYSPKSPRPHPRSSSWTGRSCVTPRRPCQSLKSANTTPSIAEPLIRFDDLILLEVLGVGTFGRVRHKLAGKISTLKAIVKASLSKHDEDNTMAEVGG
jgi:hypothetical protein